MIKGMNLMDRLSIEKVLKKLGNVADLNVYRFDERLLLENKSWKWYL